MSEVGRLRETDDFCTDPAELASAVKELVGDALSVPNSATIPMHDDKRFLRKLKRDIKRAGNRKRRRYLKDLDAQPADFQFGRDRSDVMNERGPGRSDPAEPDAPPP